MNKINTTEIGNNFEKASLKIIKKVIEEEQLGALKDHLRIYEKKKYYSSLRKILFSISQLKFGLQKPKDL